MPFFYWLHEFPHDHSRCAEFALRRFAKYAALEMLELVPLRGSLEVITDPLAEHLLVLPAPGEPLALAIQALVLSWSHSPAGRRAIDQTARCIPLGYKYRSRGVVMPTRCECDQLYASRQST